MSVVINGSAGVTTNSGAVYNGIQAGTAVASTSGTSIDFTGIPSWVKRITVMYAGVSTNGNSNWTLQLGDAGGFETTGYSGSCEYLEDNAGGTTFSTSFLTAISWSSAYACSGTVVLTNVSGNTWVENGVISTGVTSAALSSGSKTLSDVLTQIRISSATPDTFDAGSINILYE